MEPLDAGISAHRRRRLVAVVGAVLVATGVGVVLARRGSDEGGSVTEPASEPIAETGWLSGCADIGPIVAPGRLAAGSLGPAPTPSLAPPSRPSGPVWPTNQWWTSIFSRPNEPLWSFPIATRFSPDGIALSVSDPVASANAVVTPFVPTLTVDAGAATPQVESFGDFHVVITTTSAEAGTTHTTIAQGSAAAWVQPGVDHFSFTLTTGSQVQAADGGALVDAGTLTTDHLSIALPNGAGWDVVATTRLPWKRAGDHISTDWRGVAERPEFGIVARPVDAGPGWSDQAFSTGLDRITATSSEWKVGSGDVRQRLTWRRRRGGAGLVVSLPHQRLAAKALGVPTPGTFPSARGDLKPTMTDVIEWSAPLKAFTLTVPDVTLTSTEAATVSRELDRELAAVGRGENLAAGSYFGPKQLGRLATLADISRRFGTPATTAGLLDVLQTGVLDWLRYDGPGDQRWLGYDRVWGGIIAGTPEFGHEDYNDHHFQFGYLIQAAATLAEARPSLIPQLKPVVDLLAADLGPGTCTPGFPGYRVVNPYEGHSYASGFAPFADGNNQESSSEAVHAWWSLTRWAAASGQQELAQRATAMYAMEAATARMYWLGEGLTRPAAFAHQVSGIVWGAKVDFATFFDARPASVIGIQLLPFTFGSLYRSDPTSARARFAAGTQEGDGRWQDLLAMDLAIADPVKAEQVLESTTEFEEGNSRAFAIVWMAYQRTHRPG